MSTSIEIRGEWSVVTLSKPDEDGCYTWRCTCGASNGGPRFIADTIAEAEIHIEHQCESERILG